MRWGDGSPCTMLYLGLRVPSGSVPSNRRRWHASVAMHRAASARGSVFAQRRGQSTLPHGGKLGGRQANRGSQRTKRRRSRFSCSWRGRSATRALHRARSRRYGGIAPSRRGAAGKARTSGPGGGPALTRVAGPSVSDGDQAGGRAIGAMRADDRAPER